MSPNLFQNDPLSRTVMSFLLILQLGATAIVLGLRLLDLFLLALVTSLLTFSVLIAVIYWLYTRYKDLPIVREKRALERLVSKFQKHVQVDGQSINAAIKERNHLVRAEKEEFHTALRALQRNYIENGLAEANIQDAAIAGVGPKLKEQLAQFGIRNAAQVSSEIAAIPGFGEEEYQALLAWRSSVLTTLEGTKPDALPPRQLAAIQRRYQPLQDKNNAAERKAISSQQILEHELMWLRPRHRYLRRITFLVYLSHLLTSRGIVAALVAFVLITTQVVSSISATLAFGTLHAAAIGASIPTGTLTAPQTSTLIVIFTATITETPTAAVPPSQTFTPTGTNTPTVTRTDSPTRTPR